MLPLKVGTSEAPGSKSKRGMMTDDDALLHLSLRFKKVLCFFFFWNLHFKINFTPRALLKGAIRTEVQCQLESRCSCKILGARGTKKDQWGYLSIAHSGGGFTAPVMRRIRGHI